MSKKSNDSVEEFFKKGVRKSDITFRESDWQKMERMLDEKAMVGSASTSRSLKRIVSVVVIVALLSSIYFLIPGDEQGSALIKRDQLAAKSEQNVADASQNKTEVQATTSEEKISGQIESQHEGVDKSTKASATQPKTTADRVVSSSESSAKAVMRAERKTLSPSPPGNNGARTLPQSDIATINNESIVKQELTDRGIEDASLHNSDTNGVIAQSQNADISVGRSDVQQKKVSQGDVRETQTSGIELIQERPAMVHSSSTRDQNSSNTSRNVDRSEREILVDNSSAARSDSTDVVKEQEKASESAAVETKSDEDRQEQTITPSRWSVALVVAPEFSSTSFDKQTVPGSAYGLTIGYRIWNRLSVHAGVIKTYKKYVGYGEDYQPPAGYWQFKTNGVVPDEVSGQCSVIEVPLMLQYDLLQREKFRLFASAGVSSYRMLNEKYDYTFNEPNDGAADGWSTDQPSSYYFSVGHLSVGYDRRLYRGLHVGIEPYVKIPFGGIGWSNVNLLTMGAYLNVRYKFSKRN